MERTLHWLVAKVWLCIAVGILRVCSAAEIPFNVPFQVVQPTANHTSMIVTDGLSRLIHHEQSIALVSVVGPYHSGKSFLLNALVGDTHVFQIGRKTSPETMGIWVCRTEMKASDGSEVWLMDSEGFFGPGVSDSYDAKIFTVASLLGAHLVYNTVKIIDQQAVNLLEMLARRAQLFRTRSSTAATDIETPEFLNIRSFPPLTWVVEDFVQELPEEHRHEDGATSWFRSYLTNVDDATVDDANVNDTNASQNEDHFLSRLYKDLKVHTLFLPATSKAHLQDLSKLNWTQLTPEFQDELHSLKNHILSKLEARKFEGNRMTGHMLERALKFMVQALQRGMFHELPAIWATWTVQVADMSLQDADTWFVSLITAIDDGDDPIRLELFNSRIEEARARTTNFYRDLLHDFEVVPDIGGLEKRIAVHVQRKFLLYHERIQRWVGDLIAQAKENVGKFIASIDVPMEPEVLREKGENESKTVVDDFSVQLRAFELHDTEVKFGSSAQRQIFSKDYVNMLRNDIRNIQSNRELENDHEILRFFQMAVAAADDAVAREIKQNENRLFGKAKMKELQNRVAVNCWQAFDEQLNKHKWMLRSPQHRLHKHLVQADKFESRLSRFAATNDQRLDSHFRTVLERCIKSYKERKAAVQLPISKADLVTEQRRLNSAIQEILDEQGKDLNDTEAFQFAARSLKAIMEEGGQYMQQKNVQLWTAHSDEATRCAVLRNHAIEQRCGLSCLFNKVPQVHKSTSRSHLFDCFKQSGTQVALLPEMQQDVFENWYSKDLAADASIVWTNFYIGSALLGSCVLMFCGLLTRH